MKHILCAFLILANAASPLSYGAEAELATAANSLTPHTVSRESVGNCEVQVSAPAEAKYKPVGYVTGDVVNQLTRKTPLLFTPLYFRALGAALNKAGFTNISNQKGVFFDNIADTLKKEVLTDLDGKSPSNIQVQGKVATYMFEHMVASLKLNKAYEKREEVKSDAKNAYFDNSDDFEQVHDYLIDHLSHKREIIELFRVSLPMGVRMAADNMGSSLPKSIFYTSIATGTAGFATYFFTKLIYMFGSPGAAGFLPMFFPAISSVAAGTYVYVTTVPKSHLQKLQIWLMNRANRSILKKAGLIGKEDGESTGLIRAIFKDLGELQNQVNVSDIKAVAPVLPRSGEQQDIEKGMLTYADQLGQQTAIVSAFSMEISTEIQKQARQMGEPLYSIQRLFKLQGDSTQTKVPENARIAIKEYSDQVVKAFDMLQEVENEYRALIEQHDLHLQVLQGWFRVNEPSLSVRSKSVVQGKLAALETAKTTIETFLQVAITQREALANEKTALETALNSVSIMASNQALSAAQSKTLLNSIAALTASVDRAHATAIDDSEKFETTAEGAKP